MKCPSCARDIDEKSFPSGVTFCPYCGKGIPSLAKQDESLAFCPYCGGELKPGMKFCPNCGKEIELHAAETEAEAETELHKSSEILERAAGVIKGTFSADRKKRKLYKQWVEFSGLPPEEIQAFEEKELIEQQKRNPVRVIHGDDRKNISTLYMVLGASIILFVAAVVIILVIFLS